MNFPSLHLVLVIPSLFCVFDLCPNRQSIIDSHLTHYAQNQFYTFLEVVITAT